MKTPLSGRTVSINREFVLGKMRDRGLTYEELALKLDVKPATLTNWLTHNKTAYWSNVYALQEVLEVDSLDKLVCMPSIQSGSTDSNGSVAKEVVHEWIVDEVQSPWISTSNKLQFQICRLKHQHVARLGRGKRYELRYMSTKEKDRCRDQLLRHAQVCTAMGQHPHVIQNITTFPSSTGDVWWVIDQWIEGVSLLDALQAATVPNLDTRKLLTQIAQALDALHAHGIIRRELSPATILLREPTRDAVLTEFELAKLTDGSPTVSRDDWPTDPYRAPEACAGDLNKHADIYAWARLAVHLLLGELPEKGNEAKVICSAKLPVRIEELLVRCLSISWRKRPTDFYEILNELRQWK